LRECFGDCDGDRQVAIAEIVRLVNIAAGRSSATDCAFLGARGIATIGIADLIAAVQSGLDGC
jgi:hypothetical protein